MRKKFSLNLSKPSKVDHDAPLLGWVGSQSSNLNPGRGLPTTARELAVRARGDHRDDEDHAQIVVTDKEETVSQGTPLLDRLSSTGVKLREAYQTLRECSERSMPVGQAGEWLLDNYYIIIDHLDSVKDMLPRSFYKELPVLPNGPDRGDPRAYEVATELMSATSGVLAMDSLDLFVREYQKVQPLTMGELWALPLFLRIALIANIGRAARRIIDRLHQIQLADQWSEELCSTSQIRQHQATRRFLDPSNLSVTLSPSFTTRLLANLRGARGPTPVQLVEKFLADEGFDSEGAAREENSKLAITNVMMANSITSLRTIQRENWRAFFERHSRTEDILRADPIYAMMTFSTRDAYRHAVEKIARRGSSVEEETVAKVAIELSRHSRATISADDPQTGSGCNIGANSTGVYSSVSKEKGVEAHVDNLPQVQLVPTTTTPDHRRCHVGFYLMEREGLEQLERLCEVKLSLFDRIRRRISAQPAMFWFVPMLLLTGVIYIYFCNFFFGGNAPAQTVWTSWGIWTEPSPSPSVGWFGAGLLFAGMAFLFANDIAIALLGQFYTNVMPPTTLPRLDFMTNPIPAECKVIVTVPLLLGSDPRSVVEQLECQFLANRANNIYFALLTDLADANAEELPSDKEIINTAVDAMEALNGKYPEQCFFLFHRPREWNETQGKGGRWIAWERKRGKLVQFAHFLLHMDDPASREPFSHIVGDTEKLRGVRYICTLDADTVLPQDGVKKLLGTAAHPLNQPILDETTRTVVAGYGVLQPRITTRLRSDCTKFAALFSGRPGVDVYTTAVSDLWMDLFGEGTFTGKGLFDVRAFEAATSGRFLENRILSHDLIEGTYARCGLVTDLEVFDDFPSHYIAWSKRKHRWVRGDWQLLRWGVGMEFACRETKERIAGINLLSRWKVFDNLRRTLVEISQINMFLVAWIMMDTKHMMRASLIALISFLMPWMLSFLWGICRPPLSAKVSLRNYYLEVLRDFRQTLIQAFVTLAFLPHQGISVTDAILRTLYRLRTKRNLLEWTTFSQVEAQMKSQTHGTLWLRMWDATILSSVLFVSLLFKLAREDLRYLHPLWWLMVPVLIALGLLWLCAPTVAHKLSSEHDIPPHDVLHRDGRMVALRYALLHWRYFDQFVGEPTQWLVPDNWQEVPAPVGKVAYRTSPTNIALQLLAIITAKDLCFISTQEAVRRLSKTFESLRKMARYKGHWFNWYEISTPKLKTLYPEYVSVVDSGNLAGAMLTVRSALLEILEGVDNTVSAKKSTGTLKLQFNAILAALLIVQRLLGASAPRIGGKISRKVGTEGLLRQPVAIAVDLMRNALRKISMNTECNRDAGCISPASTASSFGYEKREIDFDALRRRLVAQMKIAMDAVVNQHSSAVLEISYWLKWTLKMVEETFANASASDRIGTGRAPPDTEISSPETTAPPTPCSTFDPELLRQVQFLADECQRLVDQMDFSFMYHTQTNLFAIGFDKSANKVDRGTYDLLASECRLASFVAVAMSQVPAEHWFTLGRSLAPSTSGVLVSWSGTMFEYLMPLLLMETYPNTLLDRSMRAAVQEHIDYTARTFGSSVPWGMSESAFNVRGSNSDYQYRAFGVPTIALKRGQDRDYVVAPYASILAMMVAPKDALHNLSLLERLGALGPYGFRDAVDYTRPEAYSEHAVVHTFMAHHIGMSLSALNNVLNDGILQKRFHAHPYIISAQILLHERVPRQLATAKVTAAGPSDEDPSVPRSRMLPKQREEGITDEEGIKSDRDTFIPLRVREYDHVDTAQPRVALLGTVPYTLMISVAGSGFSNCKNNAIYRWRNDATLDETGHYFYVRKLTPIALDTGNRIFSATHMPTRTAADQYKASFAVDSAVFRRVDGDLSTWTTISVSTVHSAEIRLVTIRNLSPEITHNVEVTSYMEVVLQPMPADRAHKAFGNLFVTTEWNNDMKALFATRKSRADPKHTLHCAHVVAIHGKTIVEGPIEYETDRSKFVGRARSTRNPVAMDFKTSATRPQSGDTSGFPWMDSGFSRLTTEPLSGTVGAVLDPIFSIRVKMRIPPGQTAQLAFTTMLSEKKRTLVERAEYYSNFHSSLQTIQISQSETEEELLDLGITSEQAMLYQNVFGHVMFRQPALGTPNLLMDSKLGQETLWAHGISGDWPVLLCLIETDAGLGTLLNMLLAHHYFRRKGVMVDVVIINTQPISYLQDLQSEIMNLVHRVSDASLVDKPGGVFVRRKNMLPPEVFRVLQAIARVHVNCDNEKVEWESFQTTPDPYFRPPALRARFMPVTKLPGTGMSRVFSLDQDMYDKLQGELGVTPRGSQRKEKKPITSPPVSPVLPPPLTIKEAAGNATGTVGSVAGDIAPLPPIPSEYAERHHESPAVLSLASLPPLNMDNGYGGVNENGDYEIRIAGKVVPPAAWSNVIANEYGGTLVTECGGGFTWADNSFMYRLTPWSNDVVSDPPSEIIYLRDDMTGEIWSATPQPIMHSELYRVIHRPGETVFMHEYHNIHTVLRVGMARNDPVKICALQIHNRGNTRRALSICSFVPWVLGEQREHTQHQIYTWQQEKTTALCARRLIDTAFAPMLAFHWSSEEPGAKTDYTCDRREFLGRNGVLDYPLGLVVEKWDGFFGAAHDPCAARMQQRFLEPGARTCIVFLLGAVKEEDDTGDLVAKTIWKFGKSHDAEVELDQAVAEWDRRLKMVQVYTPDPGMNVMVNRWLLYQVLSCRIWARSAMYQSGGAFGFRDQLQDMLAMIMTEPSIVRKHLVRSARRQFKEGDVMHWWHEPSGKGVRTKISDDLLFLPYVVAKYVTITGDSSVLDEIVPYIEMREVKKEEEDVYDAPRVSSITASVYDHCLQALHRGATTGQHGLPLIGTGDWNDGMNRVGKNGQGESVWLAWFLVAVSKAFLPLARNRNDTDAITFLESIRDKYMRAANAAWDGEWFLRAYFDDGTPLGSSKNAECKIDCIAQAWSILAGTGEEKKAMKALQSVDKMLVDTTCGVPGIIKLLTPPFELSSRTTRHSSMISRMSVGLLRSTSDGSFSLLHQPPAESPLTITEKDPGYIASYLPGVRENGAQYTHAAIWVVMANALAGRGDRAFELFDMVNPLSHGSSKERVDVYRVEPFVMSADVYSSPQHEGRGGWSWYTGSASWMYRTAVESMLGLHVTDGKYLTINPVIPSRWKSFSMDYRPAVGILYSIKVENPNGVQRGVVNVKVDGVEVSENVIFMNLADQAFEQSSGSDQTTEIVHQVEVLMGTPGDQ